MPSNNGMFTDVTDVFLSKVMCLYVLFYGNFNLDIIITISLILCKSKPSQKYEVFRCICSFIYIISYCLFIWTSVIFGS